MTIDPSCPVPLRGTTIQLAHGGGGRLMRDLIERVFAAELGGEALAARHDSAVVDMGGGRVAFTPDSYVVSPRFFPGGDIGKLAVYGTVNDLAVAGARPRYLSVAFVLEEGLALEELARVVRSMRDAARECGVEVATGDTKVVDRGHGDGVFVNTSGIGVVADGVSIAPRRVQPGDAVLLSGDVGRHGIAVLSVREGLAFETPVESDCASIAPLALGLLDAAVDVRCMRDPTRGGLAATLNEIAVDAGVAVEGDEAAIPVAEPVAAACEILGLDPLYVACEGRLVAFVPGNQADRALAAMRAHPAGRGAVAIGRIAASGAAPVSMRTRLGTRRVLDLLSGAQLPRIC